MKKDHKEILEYMEKHPAYQYAIDVTTGKYEAGRYIKKQCQNFLDDIHDENCNFFIDIGEVQLITDLLRFINFSTGAKAGKPVYDGLSGFQWFFIISALCWKHKDIPIKRRFEKSVLLIARKSGKTFLVALVFIILLIVEPQFSEFYSVAPDRELSSIVKKELEQMIAVSPVIGDYFKVTRDMVECTLTNSKFQPLAYSENRMDGRHADVFLADEVGALRSSGPIESMQSSQMNMVNRTGILISTAYESIDNPMINEVEYAKKVLDGVIEDETLFSLLYEPDNPKDWMSDKSILQANPLCYDVPDNMDYLRKQRQRALSMPTSRSNFLTKHLNIFVDGQMLDGYINHDDLIRCRLDEKYDWYGKEVYIGVDLSITTDNTAVTMVTRDEEIGKYIAKSWAFAPNANIDEKIEKEKVDYYREEKNGNCFLVGDRIIDYAFIEDFVLTLEENFGVIIKGIGYDRYNAMSSAQKWDNAGYQTIDVGQRSSILHKPTKRLKELILEEEFGYEKNRLLEINFANARIAEDTNRNMYVNKKRSAGKIDMVAALINAMFLWVDEEEDGVSVYESRGIITF